MLKRIISILLVLCALFNLSVFAEEAEEQDKAHKGFSVKILNNGAEVSRVKLGDEFTLRLTMTGIDPMTVLIPIKWNPQKAQVIDPKTGNAVSSGLKKNSDTINNAGFKVGEKCYDKSEDIVGNKLWWNGLPQFSENPESEDGYPYLNQATGFYKFLYYVYVPSEPSEEQTILDVTFKALEAGNPEFHFATSADAEGMTSDEAKQYYDSAAQDGIEGLFNVIDGEAEIKNFTESTKIPEMRIITDEDINKPEVIPTPPVTHRPSGGGGNNGKPTSDGEDSVEEKKEIKYLTDLVEPHKVNDKSIKDIFPYQNADSIQAQVLIENEKEPIVDEDSEYTVTIGSITDYLNNLTKVPSGIIFTMPDKIIDKEEYTINIEGRIINYLYSSGIPMVYVETPYGYVGINPYVLVADLGPECNLRLQATPVIDKDKIQQGITVKLWTDYIQVYNLAGNIFRIIVPYAGDAKHGVKNKNESTKSAPLVLSTDVFGKLAVNYELPLSINKYDEKSSALIFLSPCTGSFKIKEKSAISFADLDNVQWAKEPIEKLAESLVLNGTGDGLFSPDDNVTREQFAKMIVSASAMYQDCSDAIFTDLDKNSIFYPYVTSANKAGLVNGVSYDTYAGSESITREDLATICYRCAEQIGIELPEVRAIKAFSDDSEISDYARDAVYALYKAGIIDGTGDGFDPKGNATRAAAAKILYGVVKDITDLL